MKFRSRAVAQCSFVIVGLLLCHWTSLQAQVEVLQDPWMITQPWGTPAASGDHWVIPVAGGVMARSTDAGRTLRMARGLGWRSAEATFAVTTTGRMLMADGGAVYEISERPGTWSAALVELDEGVDAIVAQGADFLAVDRAGLVWRLPPTGMPIRAGRMDARTDRLVVGPDSTVYAYRPGGDVLLSSKDLSTWTPVEPYGAERWHRVAVGPDGTVIAVVDTAVGASPALFWWSSYDSRIVEFTAPEEWKGIVSIDAVAAGRQDTLYAIMTVGTDTTPAPYLVAFTRDRWGWNLGYAPFGGMPWGDGIMLPIGGGVNGEGRFLFHADHLTAAFDVAIMSSGQGGPQYIGADVLHGDDPTFSMVGVDHGDGGRIIVHGVRYLVEDDLDKTFAGDAATFTATYDGDTTMTETVFFRDGTMLPARDTGAESGGAGREVAVPTYLHTLVSTDGGLGWELWPIPVDLQGRNSHRDLDGRRVVRLGGTSMAMVGLYDVDGRRGMTAYVSSTHGRTWEPVETPIIRDLAYGEWTIVPVDTAHWLLMNAVGEPGILWNRVTGDTIAVPILIDRPGVQVSLVKPTGDGGVVMVTRMLGVEYDPAHLRRYDGFTGTLKHDVAVDEGCGGNLPAITVSEAGPMLVYGPCRPAVLSLDGGRSWTDAPLVPADDAEGWQFTVVDRVADRQWAALASRTEQDSTWSRPWLVRVRPRWDDIVSVGTEPASAAGRQGTSGIDVATRAGGVDVRLGDDVPDGTFDWTMHDLRGVAVAGGRIEGRREVHLPTTGLSSGMYLLQIEHAGQGLSWRRVFLRP